MITAEDFNRKLKQFCTQPLSTPEGWDEVVAAYPYFQLARLMKVRGEESWEDTVYLSMLFEDREFLYRLKTAGRKEKEDFAEGSEMEKDPALEISLDELVQKFNENPPKLSAQSEDFSEEEVYEDLGKSSNMERMNIVSETLATIYVSQKEYDRALKIYKVLMEKHPEKSGTFAAAMEEVKTLKNAQN